MRSPSHPALNAESREYPPFVIPHLIRGDTVLDAASRIYPLFIPKENSRQYRPGHWGARTVRPESPLFFSRKRKGKAKRKLPADVRKLKNRLRGPGKKNSRAHSTSLFIPQALLLRALRLIRLGSNIFFPCSSLSAIFPSAFSHRPEGCALCSFRTVTRYSRGTRVVVPINNTYLDPASSAG